MASSYVVTKEINENHMAICCSKGISANTLQPTLPFPELQMESTLACFHGIFFPPSEDPTFKQIKQLHDRCRYLPDVWILDKTQKDNLRYQFLQNLI